MLKMEIIFLGTASMQPTKERNLFAVLIKYKSENILLDCGEGTQRQLRIVGIPPTKINKLLITHLHGDHLNGLPGFFQNLYVNQYHKTLEIYGPKGTKKFVQNVLKVTTAKNLKLKIKEIKSGIVIKTNDYIIKAAKLNHSILTYGYSFIENPRRKMNLKYLKKFNLTKHPLLRKLQHGKDIRYKGKKIKAKKATYLIPSKKITFILDTAFCQNAVNLAKNSTLLISEATFTEKHKDKARSFKHLTASQSGLLAKKSCSKELILTHFSQRYKTAKPILKEAKKIFKKVKVSKDFMKIKI